MKTKTKISKSILIMTGIVFLCCSMMSCTSEKVFTDGIRYSHLKKVKAHSTSDTVSTVKTEAPSKENYVSVKAISAKKERSLAPLSAKPFEKSTIASSTSSHSASAPVEKTEKESKIKNYNVKKFIKNKVSNLYASKSNTKDAKNPGDNILLTILLVIVGIIVAYVVLVLIFFLLIQLSGFSFAVGC